MLEISKDLHDKILAHAESVKPLEACGLLVYNYEFGSGLDYIPCENISDTPETDFVLDDRVWLSLHPEVEVVAVVHSHPDNEPFLSAFDRKLQVIGGMYWVLVTGGTLKVFCPVAHLRGRVFNYGVHDCFALVRDAYHLMNLPVRDHPRTDPETDAGNLEFEKNLPDAFVRVRGELQAGDVLLTNLCGDANHLCLYLGDSKILHHAIDRLSRVEDYDHWWQKRLHSVWRYPNFDPACMEAVFNDLEN